MIISPSPRAAVCRVGDTLEVTCRTATPRALLTWNLTMVGVPNSVIQTLSTTTLNQDIIVPLNASTLIFSRVSDLEASPLISTLVVPAVFQDLNATRITCLERSTASMATTTVYIYRGI